MLVRTGHAPSIVARRAVSKMRPGDVGPLPPCGRCPAPGCSVPLGTWYNEAHEVLTSPAFRDHRDSPQRRSADARSPLGSHGCAVSSVPAGSVPAGSVPAGRHVVPDLWVDSLIAAVLTVLGIVGATRGAGPRAVGVVAALVVGVALLLRRRRPAVTLAILLVAVTLTVAVSLPIAALVIAVEVGLYTYASTSGPRATITAAVVTGLVLFGLARASAHGPLTEPGTLIVVVWTALAAAIGNAIRTRRDYVSALAERAQRAEETRDAVARARVTDERVRIARELHDVVAHNLAIISVHAGLAGRSVRTAPDVAEESLGHVQAAARTALDELGAVLRLLRADEPDDGARPAPGLADLDELVGTFTRTGLIVRTSITGRPQLLDPACDLTAFRVIQEALANAHKHGASGRAQLDLHHRSDGVEIVVSNPVPWPVGEHDPVRGTGHGIIGMRERVASVGGSLTTRTDPDGQFRVVALVPRSPAGPGASVSDTRTENLP